VSVVGKVALKISPTKFVIVKTKLLPSARVTLANTVSTLMLSVTLTVILVLCVWLKNCGSAVALITSGTVMSNTVKFVVSVLLMFPEVSFAMMVTLYSPGASVSVVGNVALKMSPTKLVMVSNKKDPSARVTFTRTVATAMLSVMLTVMFVL